MIKRVIRRKWYKLNGEFSAWVNWSEQSVCQANIVTTKLSRCFSMFEGEDFINFVCVILFFNWNPTHLHPKEVSWIQIQTQQGLHNVYGYLLDFHIRGTFWCTLYFGQYGWQNISSLLLLQSTLLPHSVHLGISAWLKIWQVLACKMGYKVA